MSWSSDLFQALLDQLEDNTQPSTAQLLGCGHEKIDSLLSALRTLIDNTNESSSSYSRSCQALEALADEAYEKLSKGALESCWPRLFTDASIIRSLACLDSSSAQSAIGRLDRAIIVAGAAGEGRLDLVLTLIRKIQTDYLCLYNFEGTVLPSSSQKNISPIPYLQTSSHVIPSIDPPPSFVTFQTDSHREPFLLRKYASAWPAINDHPWSSEAYLRSVAGPARVVPVEVGTDYRLDGWTQELMGWDEFLTSLKLNDQLVDPSPSVQSNVLYLAQHNLLMQFPDLNRDIVIPDYAYTCPPPPADYPKYKPPGNDEQLVVNAWLGPCGTVSPAHTDPYYNLYVQIVGRKTVWLAPPAVSASMYAFSAQHSQNPASNSTSPTMSNTSRVDVFAKHKDLEASQFPRFYEHVVPRAMSATLEPGDMLFIPPGWWHAMRAEETSFSVSMWF